MKDLNLNTDELEVLLKKLRIIFFNVKSRFVYKKDIEVWDRLEYWEAEKQIPDKGLINGDCDCFALACRKECRKQNIPSRLVFCRVNVNKKWLGHLVLESIGYILDNISSDVIERDLLPYKWVSISGYEKGDSWYSLLE